MASFWRPFYLHTVFLNQIDQGFQLQLAGLVGLLLVDQDENLIILIHSVLKLFICLEYDGGVAILLTEGCKDDAVLDVSGEKQKNYTGLFQADRSL